MIWTNFTLLKEIGEREGKFYAINVPLKDGIDDPSFTRLFKTVSSILMFFWPNCNLNKLLILIFNALFLVWWRLVWTFWNSYAIDYFQSSWNISTWCDSSPVWSRFTCWRSLGLLQSLYWWCLFSSKFPILMKVSLFCYDPLFFFTSVGPYFTGHAECVRFVKRFNLPLLVGLYHCVCLPFTCIMSGI